MLRAQRADGREEGGRAERARPAHREEGEVVELAHLRGCREFTRRAVNFRQERRQLRRALARARSREPKGTLVENMACIRGNTQFIFVYAIFAKHGMYEHVRSTWWSFDLP